MITFNSKDRKLSQRHAYHSSVRGRDRNHGHTPEHRYGKIYYAYRIKGVMIKCSPPKGKHERRGF